MYNINQENKTYIYYDKESKNFSNIAVGMLIRAIGEGLNVAYIDSKNTNSKFTNFIENLSLNHSFIRNLSNFRIDTYVFKNKNLISKTLIPQVEFSNITKDMFWKSLIYYDLIIFDTSTLEEVEKIKLIGLIKNKSPKTQIIFITNKKKDFEKIKDNFNNKIICESQKNKSLGSNKKIINVIGECSGKSLYAFGYLIKGFLYKENVKLIYFDKGDIYGDSIFFYQLKKWAKENHFYGTFDYVKTGAKRYVGNQFRENVIDIDKKEAKEALNLLETALKKQSPVIADELNTIIEKKIVSINKVIDIIKNIKRELVLTGKKTSPELEAISGIIVKFYTDK